MIVGTVVLGSVLVTTASGGASADSSFPYASPGAGLAATSVALGPVHSCVLARNASIYCFGAGSASGELGIGTPGPTGAATGSVTGATAVALGAPAKAVAVGYAYSCALLFDGGVKCWGANSHGQLGQGDTTARSTPPASPIDFGNGRRATQIATGSTAACALLDDGSVKCWGNNSLGGLGYGLASTVKIGDAPGEIASQTPVNLGQSAIAVTSSSWSQTMCALLSDHSLKCWGAGLQGQLGQGNSNNLFAPASAINFGTGLTVMQVAVGDAHVCALLSDGTVKCFGYNFYGQLGLGDTANRGNTGSNGPSTYASVDLGTDDTALYVAAGSKATCVVRSDARTVCWGLNYRGALGIDNPNTSTLKIGDGPGEMGSSLATSGTADVRTLSMGADRVCALTADSSLNCWGDNTDGALALESATISILSPTRSRLDDRFSTSMSVQQVVAGHSFACALFVFGKVKCWGKNDYGQLGYGDTTTRGTAAGSIAGLQFVDLGSGAVVVKLSAGLYHVCALLSDRTVKCWGRNDFGQLGLGDTNNRGDNANEMGENLVSTAVGTGIKVFDVESRQESNCIITSDRQAKCWGWGAQGKLGNGTTQNIGDGPGEMGDSLLYARPVAGTPWRVTLIRPGLVMHTCAIDTVGVAYCWGYNAFGESGTENGGSAISRPAAIVVASGTTFADISAGFYATCGLLSTYRVRCWGSNVYGQLGLEDSDQNLRLGDGVGEMTSKPDVVLGGDGSGGQLGTIGLHSDPERTCAILASGVTKCWGRNSLGQLGQDSANNVGAATGDMGDNLAAVNFGTNRFAAATSGGDGFTCAVLSAGDAKCWGSNSFGQLGQNNSTAAGSGAGSVTMSALPVINFGSAPSNQTISFAYTGGNLPLGTSTNVNASSDSNLPVVITSTTPSICTVTTGTVTPVSVGNCVLRASQPGNSSYWPATPVDTTVPVVKASQTISFAYTSGTLFVGGSAVAATASSTSGLGVTVVSTTTGICTWSTGQVTPVAAGSCILRGTQAGNATYDAATQTDYTITIAKVAQTISLSYAGGAVAPGDPAIELSPAASSGLTVDLTSTTPLVCTVSANKVSPIANGDCIIEANQAGNATYAAASAVQATIQVSKTNQTITVTGAPASVKIGADPFGLTATSSAGLAVTLESSTPELCTVSLGLVTIVATKTGTCTIAASQVGTNAVSAASNVTTSIAIDKGDQAPLKFSGNASVGWLASSGKIPIAATGGSGTGVLSARVVAAGTASCSVTSTDIVAASVGTCDVEFTKAADDTYAAAVSAKTTLSFNVATQNVRFTSQVPTQPEVGDTISVVAVSDSSFATSPVALSVSILTRLVCSLTTNQSPATLTLKTTGTCIVRAFAPGRAGLLLSPVVSLTIAVGARTQSIDFAQPLSMKLGDPDRETIAKASSGLGIVFTSSTPTTCTIDSTGYLTAKSAGTCTLSADQPGNATYAIAATVSRSFEIDATTPTAPFVTSISAGDRSVYVAFTTPGFDGGAAIITYTVTATPEGGGTPTASACAASPCLVAGLVNGTAYSATVTARNSVGTGPASTPSRKVTPAGRPNAARNLVASLVGANLTATWSEPLSLNGGVFVRYDVSERTSGASWPAVATYQASTMATTKATYTAVKPQTPYDVKVVVITSSDGSELESNSVEALASPLTAPATPAQATALDASSREIIVSWSEPVSDGGSPITSYSVTLKGIGPCPRVEIDSATRTGRCIISDPTPGLTYTVAVAAVNAVGPGTPVVVTATTPKAPTPDVVLVEPEDSRLPSVPGFVRVTPVPVRDDTPARARLSVDVDPDSNVTAIVFVVENPNGLVAATYTVTLRNGTRVASIIVPPIDASSIVYAYARNAFGVSRNAPTDANISHRVAKELPKSSRTIRRLTPDLLFTAASSAINRTNRQYLRKIADKYGSAPVIIHVTGYARGGGAPKNFLTYISIRRAQAVARFLSRNGAKVRITYSGLGDNGKAPGTAADRRVIISVEQIGTNPTK